MRAAGRSAWWIARTSSISRSRARRRRPRAPPIATIRCPHRRRLSRPAPLAEYADLDRALADLRAHTVSGVFVVEPDYLSSGRITAFSNDTGLLSLPAARRRQTQVGDAIRATLLHRALSGDALARAYAPAANVTRMQVDAQGVVSPDVASAAGPFAGSFGVFFVLTMAIFFSAGFLQQATVEDRQNRMIEILLSSLDTDELLVGKMLGLGGAGLLQVAIYLVLLIVPGILVLALIQVSIAKLALSVVYFVIGYTLFASLMAGTGMLGRTAQESAQLSAIWTLTAASPMFFLAAISASPNGMLVARAVAVSADRPGHDDDAPRRRRCAGGGRDRDHRHRHRHDLLHAASGVQNPPRGLADVRQAADAAGAGSLASSRLGRSGARHLLDPLPLRVRHRHHRQPRDPDEREVLERTSRP